MFECVTKPCAIFQKIPQLDSPKNVSKRMMFTEVELKNVEWKIWAYFDDYS